MKHVTFLFQGKEKQERIGRFCDKMREKGLKFLSDFNIVNGEPFITFDIWKD